MEETSTASAHTLADGLVVLTVLVLAIAAAVAPLTIVLVGLPSLVLHQRWTSRRRPQS